MKKNLLAVLLGFAFTLLLLGGLEIFFRWNQKTHWVPKPHNVLISNLANHVNAAKSEQLYQQLKNDPVYQWRPLVPVVTPGESEDSSQKHTLPCCIGFRDLLKDQDFHSLMLTKNSHQTIYSAHFTIDSRGRRITPKNPKSSYNILMFGDSFTLGEGVDNEDTAAYKLAALRPQAQVYNLGLSGGGPTDFLYEVELNPSPRLEDIPVRKTIVLYSILDFHMERALCPSTCLKESWMASKPSYVEKDGELFYAGPFDKSRPLTNSIYRGLNQSAFLEFFNFSWPPFFTKNDFNFVAKMMVTAQQKTQKMFKDVDFYVVMYPFGTPNFSRQLSEACKKQGLKVLDYSDLDEALLTQGYSHIPIDNHPSPITHYIFANLLNQDLPTP